MSQNTSPDGQWSPRLQSDGIDDNIMHAVGQLILCMSRAESALHWLAMKVSKIDEGVFNILTNEMKSHQIHRITKEVIAHRKYPDFYIEMMDGKLSRLTFLRDKRNQIAHWLWGTKTENKEFELKKSIHHQTPMPVTLQEIRQWADELGDLFIFFHLFALEPTEQKKIIEKLSLWVASHDSSPQKSP